MGTRTRDGLTLRRAPRNPDLEQGPEVDAARLGVVGQPATEARRQRREGMATDEVAQLGRGESPERKSGTWQQDETSLQAPARSKPSRACETLRAERRRAWDARRTVDSLEGRRDADDKPQGRRPGAEANGPTWTRPTLPGEDQAHARMTRLLSKYGPTEPHERPSRSAGNGEARMGAAQPTSADTTVLTKLEGSLLHERRPAAR